MGSEDLTTPTSKCFSKPPGSLDGDFHTFPGCPAGCEPHAMLFSASKWWVSYDIFNFGLPIVLRTMLALGLRASNGSEALEWIHPNPYVDSWKFPKFS